jgi:death-on-curing protein
MTSTIRFLKVDEVLKTHEAAIQAHGGTLEFRDRGLLESAVSMPMAQFGGQFLHDGLAAMAAAYLFHLCKNHCFVDGNKRVALATAEVFVGLNDHRLDARNTELVELTLGVADGTISKDALTKFLKKRIHHKR